MPPRREFRQAIVRQLQVCVEGETHAASSADFVAKPILYTHGWHR